ncbi:hypothetical protein J4P02_11195 [Pseudomonas sp. NFXW11]|uniref:hypothetical protein n=1 Tax=Pseudomonas sp. NFXW11 TaxID=2819531 RepID=UPI003CF80ECE
MKFICAGNSLPPYAVACRELGFGETLKGVANPYELSLEVSELSPDFVMLADIFIAECRCDDLAQGYVDIPELAALDYPSFDELCQEHGPVAVLLIKDYLYFELFFSLFPYSPQVKAVINDIASISLQGSTLFISGQTYPVRRGPGLPG